MTVLRLAAAVATFLVMPASAAAATPLAGALYEGPRTSDERKVRDVQLQMSSSARRIRYLNGTYHRNCRVPGRPATRVGQLGLIGLRNVRVTPSGRFSFRRHQRFPQTGGFAELRVSGRFVGDGTRFTATVSEKLHNPQNGARCNSGTRTFGGAVPRRRLVNGGWSGSLADGGALSFRVTDSGVGAVTFSVSIPCEDGTRLTRRFGSDSDDNTDVRTDDDELTFVGTSYGSSPEPVTLEIKGRLDRRGATGTVTARGFKRGTGEDSIRCELAPVSWTARLGSR